MLLIQFSLLANKIDFMSPEKSYIDNDMQSFFLEADSTEKFYPRGFDFSEQDRRAEILARQLGEATGSYPNIEDYSANQDGSLFLRILLVSKKSLGKTAYVLISSFGNFLTIIDGNPHEIPKIKEISEKNGYLFVPSDQARTPYNGKNSFFDGETWFYRFFSPWYYRKS